jgi:hypothetical protein
LRVVRHRFLRMFCRFNTQIKDTRPSGLLDTTQSCRNSIRSACRCRHSRNYPAVIVQAAVVAVINQSLTLSSAPRVAIYTEYHRASASAVNIEAGEQNSAAESPDASRCAKSVITSSLCNFTINARLTGATRRCDIVIACHHNARWNGIVHAPSMFRATPFVHLFINVRTRFGEQECVSYTHRSSFSKDEGKD